MTDDLTRPEPMPRPPVGCSCIWANTDRSGSVYVADRHCPAAPHARWWRAPLEHRTALAQEHHR